MAEPPSDEATLGDEKDASEVDQDATRTGMLAAVGAFVGSKSGQAFIVGCITDRLGKDVNPELLEDLRQNASLAAITARSLPSFRWFIEGWVRRVTRRTIANYFRAAAVHAKYLDPEARAERQADKDGGETDYAARERLIAEWLDRQAAGDPRDHATLRLMMEHEIEGTELAAIAKREGTTPSALSNRFHKLRKKYVPRLALMDDEKKRSLVIGLLLFFFGAAIVALVIWLLSSRAASEPPAQPVVKPRPVPTASAPPAPSFDQALPPRQEAPPTGPPEGPVKPEAPKP